jgi:hypothetical protein
MTNLSPEAEAAYAAGIAPLGHIEGEIVALVEARDMFLWEAS